MKVSLAAVLGALCIGNGQGFEVKSLIANGQKTIQREMMAVAQEMGFDMQGRRLDSTTDAMACAGAAPCSSNGCIMKALTAMGNPVCTLAVYNASTTLTPEASDGHSLGVATMMLGGDIGAFTEAACNGYNNSTLGSVCAGTVPLEAIITTMEAQKDGSCVNFNNNILGLVNNGDDDEGESTSGGDEDEWTAVAEASVTQKAVIDQTAAGIIAGLLGNETSAAVEAGLTKLDLTWSQLFAPLLGFTGGDMATVIGGAAFGAYVADMQMTDVAILTMAGQLLAGVSTAEDVPAFLASTYGTEAATALIANITAVQGMPTSVVSAVTSFFTNETYTEEMLSADVAAGILGTCLASSDATDTSGKKVDIFTAIGAGSLNITDTDSVSTWIGSNCVEGNVVNECTADIQAAGACLLATTEIVVPEIEGMEAWITAYISAQPGSIFLGYMETGMGALVAPLAAVTDIFSRYADNTPTPEDIGFIQGLMLGCGCALASVGATENGDPSLVGPTSCYILNLMTVNPALFMAFTDDNTNLTATQIFGMSDSLHNLDERCSAVGVTIPFVPLATSSPTSPPVTGSPTTQTLNAGVSVTPSLITIASLISALALLLA